MSDIMFNFPSNQQEEYLTKEQIKESTPLVFAEAPTNPGVSNKYLFVNTETIIDDLAKLGPRRSHLWGTPLVPFHHELVPRRPPSVGQPRRRRHEVIPRAQSIGRRIRQPFL